MSMMVSKELLQKDLGGQYIIVTGANSGIGKCVALQLLKQGATVVMGTRKIENGELVRNEMKDPDARPRLHILQLDLADFPSIRDFATKVRSVVPHIDVLVHNAGIMNTPFSRTKQGHEIQMGVNHIGPFLLTELLTDFLRGSPDAPARIITTSSAFAVFYNDKKTHVAINWDDFHWSERENKYDAWKAYNESKLANVYHAMELSRRFAESGQNVVAVSLHPGFVRSNLLRHTIPWLFRGIANFFFRHAWGQINGWEGSQTTLQCVLAPKLEAGAFYSPVDSPSNFFPKDIKSTLGWPCTAYPNPNMTEENAKKLWAISEECVKAGLTFSVEEHDS